MLTSHQIYIVMHVNYGDNEEDGQAAGHLGKKALCVRN